MAEGPSEQIDDRIPVGYVRKAHGIRGDVVVRGLVDDARTRFIVGASFLTDESAPQTLTIKSVAPLRDDFRISFGEVGDRNRSEELKGTQITVPASERRALEDGEWWPEDLVGCNVMSVSGGKVGEIAAEAGFPGAARAVGSLLRTTPGLPWWRVIAASGRLVPGLESEHAQRLRAEGITISKGKVRMGQ